MQKLLLFLMMATLGFTGCSKDDSESGPRNQKIELKVGESYKIGGASVEVTSAPDEFVAEIKNGAIVGNHFGTTWASVNVNGQTCNYSISVDAKTTLYIDLKFLLGATKENIEKLYGEPTEVNGKTCFYGKFLLENRNAFVYDDNDKVIMAAIYFSTAYASTLGEHLADRYVYVGTSDSKMMYIDSLDINTYKTMVLVQVGTSEIVVAYAPRTLTDSAMQAVKKGLSPR